MTQGTAIIAGQGALPGLLARRLEAEGAPFVLAEMEGFVVENPGGWPVERFIVERLALLFDRLRDLGMTRVVFAGAVSRPALDPGRIDPKSAMLLPALIPAFQAGDDALLRAVIGLFEDAGFDVVGADAIAPELVPGEGVLTPDQPSEDDRADAARAAQIVTALGAIDVGQGAVVAQGLCLAVETLPGTDAMLRWLADVAGGCRADAAGAKGVFYKAPKPGQDRRVDLPVIGPGTVAGVARAGLAGIVIEAGGVMILEREATLAAAQAEGLFIWARLP
ncbi:MAG: phosphatidate cytidylyltransferase [Confluentimicrobium sp.]|uniref:LpxI family protein n=1 Tax=Actibacterium sp. TaxID=1872125 RepID=UPI000C4B557F|nr:UDP-2,3-diacylglucosamine diphosphatase LpxI [Actibacterium sp.]MBC57717.1 phosphatidate cytidylyltransferase [Actibacterium sp.]MDY6860026.1 UDP-2,3-diacylglucosamine diphosphatase LpxI [Pseudomonadota bacterium]